MSASEASREDRELPASERRLQQAREEGQVARSRDLVHFVSLGALLALLTAAGPLLAQQALALVTAGLRIDREAAFDTARLAPRLAQLIQAGVLLLAPVGAALALLLTGASVAVGGWNFTTQALAPKLEKLNPLAGIGHLFQWRNMLAQLRLAALAGALLGGAGWFVFHHAAEVDALARMPLHGALAAGFGWLTAGLATLLGICFVAALADVPLQIFKYRAELRMTRDEARQEHKDAEGDPHVKGQRRRRQQQLSRGRMLTAVPAASVVITNPTHYAVALRYDEGTMAAPRIVAMGADHLALKIREVATASGVPLLEAPPLARALYRHGRLDAEVPVALYTAVAQVLAWVMRLRTALRPPAAPAIELPPGLDPLEAQP